MGHNRPRIGLPVDSSMQLTVALLDTAMRDQLRTSRPRITCCYTAEELDAPPWFIGWLNDMGGPHQCRVNEVVAKMYAPAERTPPHHDFSPICQG